MRCEVQAAQNMASRLEEARRVELEVHMRAQIAEANSGKSRVRIRSGAARSSDPTKQLEGAVTMSIEMEAPNHHSASPGSKTASDPSSSGSRSSERAAAVRSISQAPIGRAQGFLSSATPPAQSHVVLQEECHAGCSVDSAGSADHSRESSDGSPGSSGENAVSRLVDSGVQRRSRGESDKSSSPNGGIEGEAARSGGMMSWFDPWQSWRTGLEEISFVHWRREQETNTDPR